MPYNFLLILFRNNYIAFNNLQGGSMVLKENHKKWFNASEGGWFNAGGENPP